MDTIIFDLDDTLADTYRATKKANRALFFHLLRTGRLRLVKALLLREHTDFLMSREDILLYDSHDFIAHFIRDADPGMPQDRIDAACTLYDLAFFSAFGLVEGARDLLAFLNPRYRLALVTDGAKRWQEEKLRRLGIAPFFDRIIISGEVGSSKLNDENFRMALEGGEDRVYVVGDRLETDIRGGNAIGATTILVRRGTFAYDRETDIIPDVTVTSLAELYRVFPAENATKGL